MPKVAQGNVKPAKQVDLNEAAMKYYLLQSSCVGNVAY